METFMTKNNEKKKVILKYVKLVLIGLFSGAVNGFFGTGGGLALVPLCRYVANLETKKAHATTLTCVWLMCICGSIVYFAHNVFDIKLILVCLVGSIFGSLIGTRLLKNLKNNVIDLIFSLVLVTAGVIMIVIN